MGTYLQHERGTEKGRIAAGIKPSETAILWGERDGRKCAVCDNLSKGVQEVRK